MQNTDKVDYLKEVNKKYNIEHFMQQNDIIRVQSSTKMTSHEFRVQQKMTSQEFRVQHNMNKAQPEILLVYFSLHIQSQ